MVMGDLVLTADEVNPVLKRLEDGGVEVTALHNHLLRASPATMYMHVNGHGAPTKLATTLREALGASKTPFGAETAHPAAGGDAGRDYRSTDQKFDLDTAAIDQALGRKGKVNGGVYQVNVPRAEMPKDSGMDVPEAMGSAIAINFQPTGSGKAAITGDFVLTADEVNPVIRALQCERHRGDRNPQPHAQRRAAPVLHAFLGQRRCPETREGTAGSARPVKVARGDRHRKRASGRG